MKKKIMFCLVVLSVVFSSNAQDIADNAIGLRLGDADGVGTEVSYQRALSSNNRLEIDLGWRNGDTFNAYKLTGLYQWVWDINNDFNWYAGVGGGIATFSAKRNSDINNDNSLFITGDIGVEYNFDIPLLIALDFRPEIGNNHFTNNTIFDIALSLRYQF